MWSGRRLTRKQLVSRPDHLWPELWKSLGKHAKLKEKQKWSEEKLHLENARTLRGIYFTIKNARKKLETSMAPAMPCKIVKNCGSGASNKIKTKLACILEADESTRLRLGKSVPNYWKTILQEKVKIHFTTIIWFTNLFLCLKLWKFLQQKQGGQGMGKIRENFGMEPDWSHKWERGDRWSKGVGRHNSFCTINGHLSAEKCWIGGKAPKI